MNDEQHLRTSPRATTRDTATYARVDAITQSNDEMCTRIFDATTLRRAHGEVSTTSETDAPRPFSS